MDSVLKFLKFDKIDGTIRIYLLVFIRKTNKENIETIWLFEI